MLEKNTLLWGLLVCIAYTSHSEVQANTRFEQLKTEVFSAPYEVRPNYKVTRKAFGKSGGSPKNNLRVAARRTLNSVKDLYEFERGQKLLQANGICFAAQWVIDHESPFTGLFAKGASSPAIVRASVALSGVLRKDKRAFGLAIKLLPDSLGDNPSLNLFALNSMGGTVTDHVLSLSMDNEPPLGRIPKFGDIRTALRMKKDLEAADREQIEHDGLGGKVKPEATFRPVTHLAAYEAEHTIAPKWVRFSPLTQARVDKDDFRDELALENYPDQKITYQIDVAADQGKKKTSAVWQTIGRLELVESVTSKVCDARLHFQHPKSQPIQ